MSKIKITKGFCLWFVIGIILYVLFTSAFVVLSGQNVKKIHISELVEHSDQISANNNTITTLGDDPKLFFTPDTDFSVDYIDIKVSGLSERLMNAQIFYSDTEGEFSGTNSVSFVITDGLNEIKFKPSKYLRLDIADKENVSFNIDSVVLRSAKNPIYEIPQGFIIFALAWLLIYFVSGVLGIRYNGIKKGIVLLLEAMLAVFLSLSLIFALDNVEYKLPVLVLTALCSFAVIYIYPRINAGNIKLPVFLTSALFVMTVFLCIAGVQTASNLTSDLGQVYQSAWEIVETGKLNTNITGEEMISYFFETSNNDYFVRYQTNIPILFVLTNFYKVLSLFGVTKTGILCNYLSIILNAAFIIVSVVFGMLSAKNLFGKKGMAAYVLLSVFFVPYYVHVNRFYTDTMSMPFTALAIWLYTLPDESFKSKYIKYVLVGAALGIGSIIKGSLLVITVAIAIHLFIKSAKKLRFAIVVFAAVIALSSAWGAYIKNCSWIDMSESNRKEFPLTHWVMMGLDRNSMGDYVQSDVEYTQKFPTKKQKQRRNIQVIKRRLGEFDSLSDFADYEFSKAARTWGDGQYMQNVHIDWGYEKDGIYKFILPYREYYSMYSIYILVYNFCLYIFAVAGGVLNLKNNKANYGMFLRLTMLGVMFFFMMWESKSRYILNFTPVFMLAAISGLEEIKNRFFCKKTVLDNDEEKLL